MMLRKRNLNVQNADQAKDAVLAVKRKNSNAKTVPPSKDVPMEEDPAPEYDFDAETLSDPYAMATYARDIFVYYKYREFFKVNDYFPRQTFFTPENRLRLVDWMVEVQETFELNHETLYLAVKLTDLFLSNGYDLDLQKAQLVGSAAIFIASKFDERSPPLIDDFIYLSGDSYKRNDLIAMEREVLKGIKFDLGAPLSYRFLRRYARVMKMEMPTLTLARFILELSLLFLDFCRLPESLIALAAYLLAVRMEKVGDWSPILQKYSGYKKEDVEPLVDSLNHMLVRGRNAANTIYNKYAHEIFFGVADIPALVDKFPATDPIGPPTRFLMK